MKRIFSIMFFVLCFILSSNVYAQDSGRDSALSDALPPEVKTVLKEIQNVMQEPFKIPLNLNTAEFLATHLKTYEQLNQQFEKLAQLVDENLFSIVQNYPDGNLQKLLIEIGEDREQNKFLYKELIEYYGYWEGKEGDLIPAVKRPRRLKQEHLAEQYRYTWCFIFMMPPVEERRFMNKRFIVTTAMGSYIDEQTTPLLETMFYNIGLGIELGASWLSNDQFEIISATAENPSTHSRDLLFRYYEKIKQSTVKGDSIVGKTLEQWMVEIVVYDEEKRNDWNRLFLQSETDKLSADAKELKEVMLSSIKSKESSK